MEEMANLLPDEACHVDEDFKCFSLADLARMDLAGNVMLHNTIRFDVQFSSIAPMLVDGDVNKAVLVAAIRDAIIKTVDDLIGQGLDGVPTFGGATVTAVEGSKMLHRERIHFDLS